MQHPKEKAHRWSGGQRDAIVGVRHFDSSLLKRGYIVVWSLKPVRFGRDCAAAGLLLVRPCCVIELRSRILRGESVREVCVTHGDGEVRVFVRESIPSLLSLMGEHAGRIPHGG